MEDDVRLAKEELHYELIGRNIFAITMIGAVAFVLACGWVMWT